MVAQKSKTKEKDSENKWFWLALDAYLEGQSLKQTKQRAVIVEYFLKADTHIDADELHRIVQKQGHDIGLATIYRTLNLLTEAGLAEQRSFTDGRSVFEILRPNHHHDHLICVECRHVIEFENSAIEALQEKVAKEFGFELVSHRLDLFGRCMKKNCERRPSIK